MLLLPLDNFLHMSSTSTATAGTHEVALRFRSVGFPGLREAPVSAGGLPFGVCGRAGEAAFAGQLELSISRLQRILPRSELNISS